MSAIQGVHRSFANVDLRQIGPPLSDFLLATAILGVGVKLGPVAVVDEVGLGIFGVGYLLTRKRLPVLSLNAYNLCLAYFAFMYLVGFILSSNINALRYIFFPTIIMLCVNLRRIDAFSVGSMEVVSYAFILITIAWPVLGAISGYPAAWWQDWVWTGTTYSAFGVFVAASILMWYGTLPRALSVLCLVFVSGALNDSRLTLLIGVILLLPLLRLLLHRKRPARVPKSKNLLRRARNVVMPIIVLALTYQIVFDENLGPKIAAVIDNTVQTVTDFAEGNLERDADRFDWNRASLDLMSENMLHFLIGAGGLSHQYDMMGRGLASSEARIRPTGIPAVIFDGGVLLLGLMFTSALSSALHLVRSRENILDGVFLASIPIASFLFLFVVNMLDCVLFWLVFKPGFISRIFCEQRYATKI